jgi:DNA-directed RNA polymerase subunit RPC12/RpoP
MSRRCRRGDLHGDLCPGGLGDAWFGTHECPACSTASLQRVRSDDVSHWWCPDCARCWRPVHGTLHQVEPLACHGCATRAKRECIALFVAGFPEFGPQRLD